MAVLQIIFKSSLISSTRVIFKGYKRNSSRFLFSFDTINYLYVKFEYVLVGLSLGKQVTSGDYILWNTLGRCPSAAATKV